MIKKSVTLIIFLTFSYGYNTDNRYLKDTHATFEESISLTFEIGYGRYLIDVASSELSRAIDYGVLEATLGMAMSWRDFNFGVTTKAVLDERQSNLYLENFERPLNDSASIERTDYSLYANYNLGEQGSLNLLYKYYKLQSNDQYINFREYDTHFNYTSQGLALSYLHYIDVGYEGSGIVLGIGGVYAKADVEIYETIDGGVDDVYIDDTQDALGVRLVVGYTYKHDNSYLSVMANAYYYDFEPLSVASHFLNTTFEKATLTEETYTIGFGYLYKF
ncbi:MAG: hypothetical protein JXQ76_13000 [Campylobacterales bacterium]|nr:hypothetical protein [Campylobacterales bacterium]